MGSIVAFDITQENKKEINKDFLKSYSSSDKKKIMENAKATLKIISEYHKSIKKQEMVTEKEMKSAIGSVKQEFFTPLPTPKTDEITDETTETLLQNDLFDDYFS